MGSTTEIFMKENKKRDSSSRTEAAPKDQPLARSSFTLAMTAKASAT